MSKYMFERLRTRNRDHNERTLSSRNAAVDFSSNDYLGLARSITLIDRFEREWKEIRYEGVGSTGSRLLTGNSEYIQELEDMVALFHGFEEGTLFSSGYMANMGLLSSIAGDNDIILYDDEIHASMRDGIKLSKADSFPFRHNDLAHLEQRLLQRRNGKSNTFICVESIYSMTGIAAPIVEIAQLSEKYSAHLIVDEAHAIGIFGKRGEGLIFENSLQSKVFALIVTFGKAAGACGACVLGREPLKRYLLNFCRPFIFTTAPSLPSLAAIKASYSLFPGMDKERKALAYAMSLMHQITGSQSSSPIHLIQCETPLNAKKAASFLKQKGLDIRAVTRPSVKKGQDGLRIILHSFNTSEELQKLQQALHELNFLPTKTTIFKNREIYLET